MIPLGQRDNCSTCHWVYHGLLHIPKVRQGTVLMEFGKFCSTKVAINSLPALRTASGETRRRTQYSWPQRRTQMQMVREGTPNGPTQMAFIKKKKTRLIYSDFPQRMGTPWQFSGNSMAVRSPGKLLTTACRTSSPSARASGASPHPGRRCLKTG
jgi:hypothetical protein